MAPYSLQQGLFIRLKNRNNVFPDWGKCVQHKHEKITIFIYRTFQNPFWHVKNVSNNKNSQVLQFFFSLITTVGAATCQQNQECTELLLAINLFSKQFAS